MHHTEEKEEGTWEVEEEEEEEEQEQQQQQQVCRSRVDFRVCVECFFSRSSGQAPYGARSACAKRAAYPGSPHRRLRQLDVKWENKIRDRDVSSSPLVAVAPTVTKDDPGENGRRIEHFIGENEHFS